MLFETTIGRYPLLTSRAVKVYVPGENVTVECDVELGEGGGAAPGIIQNTSKYVDVVLS